MSISYPKHIRRRQILKGCAAASLAIGVAPSCSFLKTECRKVERASIGDMYTLTGTNAKGKPQIYHALVSDFGLLPPEGQLVSKVAYPQLFKLMGKQFGGGGDKFRLPSLQGKPLKGMPFPDDLLPSQVLKS